MSANINPKTGIAYGYISANALNSDLMADLIYGNGGVANYQDHGFEYAKKEYMREHEITDENDLPDDWCEYLESGECDVSGVLDGVEYQSSWLGGALNFFIFFSPVVTDKANLASPCVPNAGILDILDGSVTSYDVPADWRCEVY